MTSETPTLPTPKFYSAEGSLSTKREKCRTAARVKQSANKHRVKHAPAKTAPPISRFFPHRFYNERHDPWYYSDKPQTVSFKDDHESVSTTELRNKLYKGGSSSYFEQCFVIEERLGEGSFGEVFRVRNKEDGRVFAVKRGLTPFCSLSDRNVKLNEVQKHEQLPKHRNLVRFYGAWEEKGCLYIMTELCDTSLSDYCDRHHSIPEWRVWQIFVDLLQAVRHLHKYNLVHLDVKPENAFIAFDGLCKLGDFGLVQDADKGSSEEGDSRYMAPELLEGKFSRAVDIFSLGITVLEVGTDLDIPQSGAAWSTLRQGGLLVTLAPFWKDKSEAFKNVICDMLEPDPERRPSADALFKRPSVRTAYYERQAAYYTKKLVQGRQAAVARKWDLVADDDVPLDPGDDMDFFDFTKSSRGAAPVDVEGEISSIHDSSMDAGAPLPGPLAQGAPGTHSMDDGSFDVECAGAGVVMAGAAAKRTRGLGSGPRNSTPLKMRDRGAARHHPVLPFSPPLVVGQEADSPCSSNSSPTRRRILGHPYVSVPPAGPADARKILDFGADSAGEEEW